jgi:hypothetical protein
MLKASKIQGEGPVVFGVQTKLEPLLLAHLAHYKLSKQKRIEKVMAPQVEGVKNSKKKPLNAIKVGF